MEIQKLLKQKKAVIILKAVLWGTIIATLFAFIPGSQDTEAWSSFDPVFATVATILRGKVGVALVVSEGRTGFWKYPPKLR